MAIRITRSQFDEIRRHGEETYPRECCGFLFGNNQEGVNILAKLYRANNEWQDEPGRTTPDGRIESSRNRYLITPAQYKRADDAARIGGLAIIGYYHSHPDHPAVPSGFDLDHSLWPGESYIIVSVEQGRASQLNSFTKPDYDRFEPEEVIIINDR